ncbi:MAG: AzlC family ABC transporter permease [Eubacterium sp.]
MKDKNKIKTFKFALKKSLPVLFGYLFLGSAFGIMLYDAGYNWVWAIFISLFVYAGSGQFLLVSLLSSGASLATTAIMTFFINSRHMFYGLSYIEKFKQGKWRYPFCIFGLTDETYSVNTSFSTVPENVNEPHARFLISIFDHCYWIIGSVIGSLAGQIIPLDFEGIDFSMTALFVVIFIDLVREHKGRLKAVGFIGIGCAVICLIIFGADRFLLPSLIVTVLALTAGKPYFTKAKEAE